MSAVAFAPVDHAGSEGFTLLELLVAMTLLGLLSLVLFGGLHFGRRVWETSETTIAGADRIRALQFELSHDISRAYPEISDLKGAVAFDGSQDRMTFLTPDAGGSGQLMRVSIARKPTDDGDTVEETQQPELAVGPQPPPVTRLKHVASVSIAYLGADRPNAAPVWHSQWHGRPHLPLLVRIRVQFTQDRFRWPEFVVAPRIAADVTCVFDALTRTCQGR